MSIAGLGPSPPHQQTGSGTPDLPHLIGNVTTAHPNHNWGIDILHILLKGGWLCLLAVMNRSSGFHPELAVEPDV
jgi:hypothetical protein